METYNTYQEAKIANPYEAIFRMEDGSIRTQSWINDNNFGSQTFLCVSPADQCMTVYDFLDNGNIFLVVIGTSITTKASIRFTQKTWM